MNTIVGTSHTEWGVKLTWTDGHTEVQAAKHRAEADRETRMRNDSRSRVGGASAEVVSRIVTTTDWVVAP